MSKSQAKLKTENFTIRKKYRDFRTAIRRVDQLWLKLGEVSLHKKDGKWVTQIEIYGEA